MNAFIIFNFIFGIREPVVHLISFGLGAVIQNSQVALEK